MSACANPKCPNPARQRFALYNWWQEERRQTPRVYLVCDGCAPKFFPTQSGRFDRAKAELIEGEAALR